MKIHILERRQSANIDNDTFVKLATKIACPLDPPEKLIGQIFQILVGTPKNES